MNKWIIALSVILPTLIEVIDTSVVPDVSLGAYRWQSIRRGWMKSPGRSRRIWYLTFADHYSHNRLAQQSLGRKRYSISFRWELFTASSFMCGASRNLSTLIFFRVLQGIGGGALQPISQAISSGNISPWRSMGWLWHFLAWALRVGPIVRPIVGGWITDSSVLGFGFFTSIFRSSGRFLIFMISLFIQDPPYLKRIKAKIDYWGLLLITVA